MVFRWNELFRFRLCREDGRIAQSRKRIDPRVHSSTCYVRDFSVFLFDTALLHVFQPLDDFAHELPDVELRLVEIGELPSGSNRRAFAGMKIRYWRGTRRVSFRFRLKHRDAGADHQSFLNMRLRALSGSTGWCAISETRRRASPSSVYLLALH